jgi:hypothetical protein
MAYDATALVLMSQGGGRRIFHYRTTADSMATVAAVGYFANKTNASNILANDEIWCRCTDGDFWLRASSVGTDTASGAVTTQTLGAGDGPYRGAVGTASAALLMGINELGTGTGSAFVLPTPYVGAHTQVTFMSTATANVTVTVSSAGVTIGSPAAGNTTITFTARGQSFDLIGVSATRWHLKSMVGATIA